MTDLPYPHARNDCEMCRERDADVHVLGDEFNTPGKRPLLLYQHLHRTAHRAPGDPRER